MIMAMSKENSMYLGRGLHSPKWKAAFQKNGLLYDLLEIVKSEEDLVIEIRNDYFNVYYKGGNLVKVESINSIQFDHNYYKGYKRPYYESDDKEHERMELKKALLKRQKKERNWDEFIKTMKKLMDDYWIWLQVVRHKSLKEKDIQHSLCINNTEETEYTIIDVEFQISSQAKYHYKRPICPQGRFVDADKTSPRFDIIAVRNADRQLCVIELKSGLGALKGKSGIGDHADSFEGTIGREPQVFLDEIKGVIEDKKAYGLLSKDFHVSDNNPEFLYAYSYKENEIDKDKHPINKEQQKAFFLDEMKRNHCEQYEVLFLEENNYRLSDKERCRPKRNE